MISKKLRNNLKLLKAVAKIKNVSLRKKLLTELNDDNGIYNCLREIAINTVNGNLKHKKPYLKKLLKHRQLLRKFVKPLSKKNSKRLVVQAGVILPFLLQALTALASTIVGNVIF